MSKIIRSSSILTDTSKHTDDESKGSCSLFYLTATFMLIGRPAKKPKIN